LTVPLRQVKSWVNGAKWCDWRKLVEMSATPAVRVSQHDGILRLIIDRPAVRNALNHEVVETITRCVRDAAGDPAIRLVVIAATGKVFSAGVDLARLQGLSSSTREANIADATTHCEMLRTVFTCPKPVIAAVQGSVHGGAVGLVSACDLVIATDTCRFATAEARVGLAPVLLAPYLAAAIGARAGRYHLLTGRPIEAEEALRLGLVHRLVSTEELEAAVDETIADVLRGGPAALRVTKQVLADAVLVPLEDAAIARSAGLIADARAGAEAREGVAAFLEKRTPVWPAP
jgi:methylglutaconyl-CoA hydratase